jgi:hypothetical protein
LVVVLLLVLHRSRHGRGDVAETCACRGLWRSGMDRSIVVAANAQLLRGPELRAPEREPTSVPATA